MGIEALATFVGNRQPNGFARRPDQARDRQRRADAFDPCADESPATRFARGEGVREFDHSSAVLVVREAPRLGTRLTQGGRDPIRRHLESINLQSRRPTGKIVFATDQFLLDNLQEGDAERYTPVYNFGTAVVQTSPESGRQPRVYQYAGSLLMSEVEGSDFLKWQVAWDEYLRATRNVVGGARRSLPYVVELSFRDQLRRGYLISMSQGTNSLLPGQGTLAFSMFVIHESRRGIVRPERLGERSRFNRLADTTAFEEEPGASVSRPGVGELTA